MDANTMLKPRRRELDLLRLAAFLCVAALHIGSAVWKDLPLWTPAWLGATVLRVTWAVPVFVMLSGVFLLDPERTPKLGCSACRVLTAMVLWGLVYQLSYLSQDLAGYNWRRFAAGVFTGAYHMWYLWMLLGLYALTPLLRKIAEDVRLTGYFLGLHVLWQSLCYFLPLVPVGANTVQSVLQQVDLAFVEGFPAYCLLGFCLHRWQPDRWQKRRLYGLAVLCYGISIAGNLALTWKTGVNSELFTSYRCPLLMPRAAAVFVLFEKDLVEIAEKDWAGKITDFVGKYGFHAYLSHALFIEFAVKTLGKDALAAAPLLWIPVLTAAVAVMSFGLSWGLEKLRKWSRMLWTLIL